MHSVLIIGAGPAGLCCGIALASLGVDVRIIDAGRDAPGPPGETLSPAGARLLEQLGVSENWPSGGSTWSIWGSSERRPHDWIQDPRGPARFVDRARLEAALRARLEDGDVLSTGRCRGTLAHDGEAWSVRLDGRAVRARVLVDATGRVRWVARSLGATVETLDRQIAVGATASDDPGAAAPGAFGLVEAEPTGWWYSAPTPDGDLALVAVSSPEVARTRRTPEALETALCSAPETRARVAARPLLNVRLMDAGSSRLAVPVGSAWLAVGDAAMAWDPLSSHGLTVALRTGMDAAVALHGAFEGRVSALDEYVTTLDRAWSEYLAVRVQTYASERRWPNEPYWAGRMTG